MLETAVVHRQEEDWEAPEGARLWGWTMQPVKETDEFPELSKEEAYSRGRVVFLSIFLPTSRDGR